MRYRKVDIVERAVEVLDRYGLPDLSMRRLASELGLQPSALYHHVASKQELLAAVADEVLERGRRTGQDGQGPDGLRWDEAVVAAAHELRDAMLAYRDGAELVATVHAFGLGTRRPADDLAAAFAGSGLDDGLVAVAATTVLHFVFGHVSDEQVQMQAGSVGAIDVDPLERSGRQTFDLGLSLILDGVQQRVSRGSTPSAPAR